MAPRTISRAIPPSTPPTIAPTEVCRDPGVRGAGVPDEVADVAVVAEAVEELELALPTLFEKTVSKAV